MKLRTWLLIGAVVLLLLAGSKAHGQSAASRFDRASDPGLLSTLYYCAHVQQHEFEICFAYIWNDQHLGLQLYYKYARSSSPVVSALAKCRLGVPKFYCRPRDARYEDQALQKIVDQVAGWNWPAGTINTVEGPSITILGRPNSNLRCNVAIIYTQESWLVLTEGGGQPLFGENGKVHTVVLRRIPDVRFRLDIDFQDIHIHSVLHKWIVSQLYDGRRNIRPTC